MSEHTPSGGGGSGDDFNLDDLGDWMSESSPNVHRPGDAEEIGGEESERHRPGDAEEIGGEESERHRPGDAEEIGGEESDVHRPGDAEEVGGEGPAFPWPGETGPTPGPDKPTVPESRPQAGKKGSRFRDLATGAVAAAGLLVGGSFGWNALQNTSKTPETPQPAPTPPPPPPPPVPGPDSDPPAPVAEKPREAPAEKEAPAPVAVATAAATQAASADDLYEKARGLPAGAQRASALAEAGKAALEAWDSAVQAAEKTTDGAAREAALDLADRAAIIHARFLLETRGADAVKALLNDPKTRKDPGLEHVLESILAEPRPTAGGGGGAPGASLLRPAVWLLIAIQGGAVEQDLAQATELLRLAEEAVKARPNSIDRQRTLATRARAVADLQAKAALAAQADAQKAQADAKTALAVAQKDAKAATEAKAAQAAAEKAEADAKTALAVAEKAEADAKAALAAMKANPDLSKTLTAWQGFGKDLEKTLAPKPEAAPDPAAADPGPWMKQALARVEELREKGKGDPELRSSLDRFQYGDRKWADAGQEIAGRVSLSTPLPSQRWGTMPDGETEHWLGSLTTAVRNAVPPGPPISRTAALRQFQDGLRAFEAGDHAKAFQCFDRAIANDPYDARYFMFRALCRQLRDVGGVSPTVDEAAADMRRGARLERDGQPSPKAVGVALEKVQGPARDWIESFRQPGRREGVVEPVVATPVRVGGPSVAGLPCQ